MSPVFRLDLLGDPLFSGPGGPVQGRAAHKRRVALLAVLAVARGRPVGRERLLGLLWPELTGEAARHNLSESLYVLRKELGDGAIVAASAGDVALDRAVVESDVAEFQELLEAGDAEAAVRLYRGPLLDGFYVSDAPEFERWADGERERLARACARALEQLAEAAEAEGSALRAVDGWRRLAGHDPFSSRTALRLVRALDAAGERPSALRAAASHATLLRAELGVDPDPDFQAFVAGLRTDPPRDTPPLSAPPRASLATPPSPLSPPPFTPLPLDSSPAASVADEPASSVAEATARDADRADHAAGPEPGAAPATATGPGHLVRTVDAGAPGLEPAIRRVGDGVSAAGPAVRAAGGGTSRLDGASAPRPAAGRRRGVHDAVYYAAMAGVLVGMMLAVLTVWAAERRAASAAPGYDPRRIAVLYFDDLTPRGELQYLAAGLTERLIHELGRVDALDVVSRGGVKPYRGGEVPFDSLVARLRVGSVVEGTLQRSGDSVWVTVELVDAATQSHLASREVGKPLGDVVALQRAVATEVAAALRQRLGQEVRLRRAAGETESADALRWVLQAEQLRRDAREIAGARDTLDTASAMRLLARADTLLARAEAADPRWAEPTLLRGWVEVTRAKLVAGAGTPPLLRSAARRASVVLARAPAARAEALELRGTAVIDVAMLAGDTALLAQAERDLRASVAAEPARASAWATLSQLLRIRGRLAESELAARRALDEDAFLDAAADIRHRLFFSALWLGDYAAAHRECEDGVRQFPRDWRFTECRLTLLRNDPSRPADPAAAWRLVAELDRLDPPARARARGRLYSPIYRRMLAAAVLARAGHADSARAVTARARGEVAGDADLGFSLAYDETWVRLAMGDTAGARVLVARMVRSSPTMRDYLLRDPMVRSLSPGGGLTPPAP
ncbi:MAG TPA: BTAD domain-containing putative transcriptional regulator [Longimicrobium sp.]|nr:BTAD domain-containing putative transcriptional regulator [Longimicrobium sp.]